MTMKTFITFLVMMAGTIILGLFTPWWTSAVWIMLVATVSNLRAKQGAFVGAFAIVTVWLVMIILMSMKDDTGIIAKTGILLGGLPHFAMIAITLLIGFITGLLSGWLGSSLGKVAFQNSTEKSSV